MEQFSGNYTGPYWSDGKLQTSVEFGSADPQSELDKLSRLHDSAYAHYADRGHREAADEIYARDAKVLAGKFPELAGSIVLHGNYGARQAKQLASDFGSMGPFGLVKFAANNVLNANKMIKGTYLKNEKADVERFFSTDPRKGASAVTINKPTSKLTPFEEAQQLAREEKRNAGRPLPADPAEAAQVVKGAKDFGSKVASVFNKVKEKVQSKLNSNSVVPETQQQKNERLIQKQAQNFENYQQTYMRAQQSSTKRRKYKKKKHNLQKAIRVLPAHCIH